jgi:hypothetical protein
MNGNSPVQSLIAATERWIQQPFTQMMDLTQVFLLTGLVIVSVILWSRVLAHIGE